MFSTKQSSIDGINVLDTRKKIQERESIITETMSNTTYRYNAENIQIEVDANNKYKDKYNRTIDFVKEAKHGKTPTA